MSIFEWRPLSILGEETVPVKKKTTFTQCCEVEEVIAGMVGKTVMRTHCVYSAPCTLLKQSRSVSSLLSYILLDLGSLISRFPFISATPCPAP